MPPDLHSNVATLDNAGNLTIDLDDLLGGGETVDQVYVHTIGGVYPAAGTAGTVALTQGSVVDVEIQASNEKLAHNFPVPIVLRRSVATTATLTIGGTATEAWAVISY